MRGPVRFAPIDGIRDPPRRGGPVVCARGRRRLVVAMGRRDTPNVFALLRRVPRPRSASVRRWFERFWSRKACSALFLPLRPPAAPRTSGRPARATVWRFCWSLACFLFSHEFIDASRRDGLLFFDRRSGFGGWSLTAQTSWAGRFDRGGNLCLVKVRGPRWRMPPLAAASTLS